MSIMIYVASPEEIISNVANSNGSIRFSGNNTKRINLGSLTYGDTLHLEEFESLEEIHIQSPGTVICFNKFPEKTVRVYGVFEEIIVSHGGLFFNLNRHVAVEYNVMQASAPTMWGAVISRDCNVDCGRMDALMLYSQGVEEISLGSRLSNISIIGDAMLESVILTGKNEISKLLIHDAKSLRTLNVRKQVLFCSLSNCPSIENIIGIGQWLRLDKNSCNKGNLTIGGFWLNVPKWYKEERCHLDVPHLESALELEDIQKCEDLGGTRFIVDPYDGTNASIYFENISDDDFSIGVEIPKLIEIIDSDKRDLALLALTKWCDGDLSYFEQYIVLRVAAALIYRGIDPSLVIKIRNRLFDANIRTPVVEETISNRMQRRERTKKLDEKNTNWSKPMDSVIPYHNIDLEIWLNTSLGVNFLGLGHKSYSTNQSMVYKYFNNSNLEVTPHKNQLIRELLTSALSATKSSGRNNNAETKLVYLIDEIFSDKFITSDAICVQFLIRHYDFSRSIRPELINKMINNILKIDIQPWKKAAFLFALIDVNNSTKARVALRKLTSNKNITLRESSAIDTVSLLGNNAFETGKISKPKWPYITNWRKEYKIAEA